MLFEFSSEQIKTVADELKNENVVKFRRNEVESEVAFVKEKNVEIQESDVVDKNEAEIEKEFENGSQLEENSEKKVFLGTCNETSEKG